MIKFKPQEKIYSVLRRHKITLVLQTFTILILAVVIWVLLAFLNNSYQNILESYKNLVWFGLSLYYLSLWLRLFTILTDYHLDVSIITNERIIDINQLSLFHREVSEFPLKRVQDISVKVAGPLATLFDFGDVIIRTASEQQRFIFEEIPKPYQVKDLILNLLHDELSS